MNPSLNDTLWTEGLKVRRSRILPATLIFFACIGCMMGGMMYLAGHPDVAGRSSVIEMKTSLLGTGSWPSYLSLLLQLVVTIGVLGYGLITAWIFGREFSDRTLKDLLALPVHRASIVTAKLLVILVWGILLSGIMLLTALATGALIGLPGWEVSLLGPFAKHYALATLFNGLLILPVALTASLGRGFIPPLAFAIGILILTQFLIMALPAAAYAFPWALPALVCRVAGPLFPPPVWYSFLAYGLTVVASGAATLVWWQRADQH
ncbi:MAG: ABC transporter permease [Bacteroidales bacterium]